MMDLAGTGAALLKHYKTNKYNRPVDKILISREEDSDFIRYVLKYYNLKYDDSETLPISQPMYLTEIVYMRTCDLSSVDNFRRYVIEDEYLRSNNLIC